GGRSIQRVDVSGDDGRTWITAQLHQPAAEHNNCRVWGWCLWTATVTTKRNVRIVSRAGNVQDCVCWRVFIGFFKWTLLVMFSKSILFGIIVVL
ncbi:hypothetical protein CU098_002883, partial [Rhizopus stolonifer]